MTLDIYKQGVGALVRFFPEKQLDIDLMFEYLKDLTDEQFMKAINEIIQNKEDINKATNIVALIRNKAIITNKITSGEAWGEVMGEVRRVGSWGSPVFKNPITIKAVECLGWREICLSENVEAIRAHFFRIYDSVAIRAKEEAIINPSIGIDLKKLLPDISQAKSLEGSGR